jgi:hypothetical protein
MKDPEFLKLMGRFAEANYKLGSNENKGRPQPGDITAVERARDEFLKYVDGEEVTGTSPRAWLRRQCERIDRLLSLDHNPARKASTEYDDAFHDSVHALRNIDQFATLLKLKWRGEKVSEGVEPA